jgi:hypothetical protein
VKSQPGGCGREVLRADDPKQVELLPGIGARTGEQHDQELIAAGADQHLAQQIEHADFGVNDPFAVGTADGDLVLGPQRRELVARVRQPLDQLDDVGIAVASGGGRAEIGDVRARVGRPVLLGKLRSVAGSVNKRQIA